MTDESDDYTKSFARRLEEDAERRNCWVISGGVPSPGPDNRDFHYFWKKVPLHPEEVFALRRKHFKGLGTKNPTIRYPGTAEWRMLYVKAARIVAKRIGKTGDPEDRPFPGRFTVIKLIPRSSGGRRNGVRQGDSGAAA
ncbi:MAG: hypothetical protein NTAFB05_20920 [Nitrobacter sp.]|uniref:hypothetical protein n=1 Tax=Nitrobacter sp. TaxID=29420 RepID=UPI00387DFEC7